MFPDFGLRPALGRLLNSSDDLNSGASPVAVLSYDYWTRRFERDPGVIGSTVRMGPDWRIGRTAKAFDIVGVAPEGFTGTAPGTLTAIFVPAAMQAMADVPYASVYQMFVLLQPGRDQTRSRPASRRSALGRTIEGSPRSCDPASGSGSVRIAKRLRPRPCGSRCFGRVGAADRLRERRQSYDRASRRTSL
jgi:MacB-like periplasmic core domain